MRVAACFRRTHPETGFTLPLLMGLVAIRNGKTCTWAEKTHTAKAYRVSKLEMPEAPYYG